MSIFADTARDTGELLNAYSRAIFPSVQAGVLAILIFIALSEFIPRDLSSTALWYDQLPIQDQSALTPFAPFRAGPWSDMPVSTNMGGWFAVFISLSQVAVGYGVATSGIYGLSVLAGGRKQPINSAFKLILAILRGLRVEELNERKIVYLLSWWGAIAIDTYTDIAYRSFDFTSADSIVAAMFVSILVLNLGSEYFAVHGPVRIWGLIQVAQIEAERTKQRRQRANSQKNHPSQQKGKPRSQKGHPAHSRGKPQGKPQRGQKRQPQRKDARRVRNFLGNQKKGEPGTYAIFDEHGNNVEIPAEFMEDFGHEV